MTTTTTSFAPQHKWDRNFFLVMAALAWLGIVMGFGSDIRRHLASHETPYPVIVHVHAVVFVSWLVLFTVQILLIRQRKLPAHRKLGVAMAFLAGFMVLLGPATALTVQHRDMNQPGADPAFLAIQLTDMLAFGVLVAGAIWWRKEPSTHKRLILLATLYITDAGFARWLMDGFFHLLGNGFGANWCAFYFGPALLILGVGAYDLVTRRRFHPAWLAGAVWALANQVTALNLHTFAPWAEFAKKIIARWP